MNHRQPKLGILATTILALSIGSFGCADMDSETDDLDESAPELSENVDTAAQELVYGYSASYTSSATIYTANYNILLYAGETVTIGTCGLPGATFSGDTYLRFRNPGGVQVASNDDACGGVGSMFTYTVPATGTYQLRAGCYSNTACSGAWGYSITPPPPPPPPSNTCTQHCQCPLTQSCSASNTCEGYAVFGPDTSPLKCVNTCQCQTWWSPNSICNMDSGSYGHCI